MLTQVLALPRLAPSRCVFRYPPQWAASTDGARPRGAIGLGLLYSRPVLTPLSLRDVFFLLSSLLLTALLGCTSPPHERGAVQQPGAVASDCGRSVAAVPDFTLVDVNETSPTVGSELSLSSFAGQVVVIYWAHAT